MVNSNKQTKERKKEMVTHSDITWLPELPKEEGFLCQTPQKIIQSFLSVNLETRQQILVIFWKAPLIVS